LLKKADTIGFQHKLFNDKLKELLISDAKQIISILKIGKKLESG